jgi:hypothetical protein
VILRNTKSFQKAPLSAALPSHLYHRLCLERQASQNLKPVLDQILRPHLGRRPLVVITTYLAKETIGYTPAPSALPQFQLGTPCATLGTSPHKPLLKSSLSSPRELYSLEWVGGHRLFYTSQRGGGGGGRAQYLAACGFAPLCLPMPAPPSTAAPGSAARSFTRTHPPTAPPAYIYPLKWSSQACVFVVVCCSARSHVCADFHCQFRALQ